ncbi:MAG: aminoglycoside phosphotransferase family protein [Chloroflexi bacterium]|nr:aminoglycoside phosphotransferase family protein [Chloroflexota bacterium]
MFIGDQRVLKIDPTEDRSGGFTLDQELSGVRLGDVTAPEVVGSGTVGGHEWLETARIAGTPGHIAWMKFGADERSMFCSQMRDVLARWRQIPIPASVNDATEHLATHEAMQITLIEATPFLPTRYIEPVTHLMSQVQNLPVRQAPVLVHRDFWPGNLLVDAHGIITGVLDFGHTVAAEPITELDTPLRYWRHPWLFVEEENEGFYGAPLERSLIIGLVEDASVGHDEHEAALKVAGLDLSYRLRKIGQWGWNDDQEVFLQNILDGGLLEWLRA